MKIKLGIIGTGFAWDRLHYPAIKELADQYEIVAVCNKTIEKAQGFADSIGLKNVYADYKQMLLQEDIDTVDLLVPISENFEIARDVLHAGKNLIAEKPFAATLEGAEELIRLKNSKNLKVMVAENLRYEECSAIIKDSITKGEIGEVMYFILNTGADFESDMVTDTFAAKEWRQHPAFKGGIFLDGGIHDIALVRYLFGNIEDRKAFAKPQNKDYCPYMSINALLRFESGVTGHYSYASSNTEIQKPPVGLRIFGTAGDIYLESKESGVVYVNIKNQPQKQLPFTPGRGYYNEFLNFYNGDIVSTPEKETEDIKELFNIIDQL